MNRINNNRRKREKLQKDKKIKKKNEDSKKEKKTFSLFKFLLKLILIIIVFILILGAIFYYKMQENGGGIKGALITVLGLSVEEIQDLEPINILLLGISEDINSKLTDTIIVCSYNPQNRTASMLSIPRDTFVGKSKASAKGSDKINALYARSPEKLMNTVTEITGIELDYYAVVNNNAVIEIVDIIGGINFNIPIDMDYDDPTQDLHIHLKSGMQKIDGERAEQLLRFRHNNDGSSYPVSYGDNDYGRMKTQREFISETLKQTLVVRNLPRARKLLNTLFNNLETNIDMNKLLPYIPTAIEFDINTIVSKQLPGESEKLNDLWFFVHNKKATKIMVKELQETIK